MGLSLKKYSLLLLAVALALPIAKPIDAHSIEPIDCINVDSANLVEGSFVTFEYVLRLSSLCRLNSISDIELIRGASISLEIRGPQLIRKSASVGNLSSSQEISFQLGNLRDGLYSPSLRLSKAGQNTRTIRLPDFTISNVLECIEMTGNSTEERSGILFLKVFLRNSCYSISESDILSEYIQLELITNLYPLLRSEVLRLNRLSSSESLYVFPLQNFPAGIYWDWNNHLKVFTSNEIRELPIRSFVVPEKVSNSSSPSALPSPSKTSTAKDPLTDIQQCVTSKGFDESCTYAPDWYFEFCTNSIEGALEQKFGSAWKFVKKVKASRTDKSCGKNFNLFEIDGVSYSANKKLTFRVKLNATSKYAQSSILFYVTPKYKP